ncbi:hypothetical protein [Alloprevotella tannerae]|uniref:hypothetical protein n=1 Tax=Alloprevotella tannerae TaxID=76122 RepID=UPI0028EF7348|nr:hypothetical protein [Alloprevotella tannerae]
MNDYKVCFLSTSADKGDSARLQRTSVCRQRSISFARLETAGVSSLLGLTSPASQRATRPQDDKKAE